MAPKVAVILAGCGFLDGAEVHEAVLTLYHLDRAGAAVTCFAPDRDQFHVVDHATGEPTDEVRNVRTESARIARGAVEDLSELDVSSFDGVVMPGGFGVAKNLSDFALSGHQCDVNPDLVAAVGTALETKTPIVAICISPAILAAALKRHGITGATVTIGSDQSTAAAIETLGQAHQVCAVQEISVDETHRLVCTPAYMLGPGPAGVGEGIGNAIDHLMRWIG
ncbi:MAG: isoprenoid biosynthesis protein ElbB [Phycisphaeraceae bacterium]|nr:isoprenoid biosynthesis protein ElbB [Phycisphaeraceae bacterium]